MLQVSKLRWNKKACLKNARLISGHQVLKAHSQVWDNFGNCKFFKNYENAFYFTSKAPFFLKTFKFFVLTFRSRRKNVWLEGEG